MNTNELRKLANRATQECMYSDFYAATGPDAVIALLDEIDRLHTEAVAADIRIGNDALVIAERTAERDALARCKLADQDAYVAMRDQRDAAQDDAKRYQWLRMQDWFDGKLCVVREPKRVFSDGVKLGTDCPSRDRLDDAIDVAMKGEQP